ncbi:DUF2637 domain-containing protein [Hamadaea sp. NPDC050747]|uniref:DUF2637 domain-containing protein n=1 Tax=Hamadaea sp. NPDC050747 TaxID=3155789 RepID=UPI0033D49A30
MLLIGGAAGAASFRHVHDVAAAHGQLGLLAWGDAVILELMSIAAGLELRRRKRVGKPVRFVGAVLTVAVALSLSAQVVEAEPSSIGWLAAALPAFGFLAMVKMAMGRADARTAQDGPHPVRDARASDLDRTRLVPELSEALRTVRDRPRATVDVSALVPAARIAAASLAAQGVPVNRASLSEQLRADGQRLSTATATALMRRLNERPASGLSADPGAQSER